MSKKNEGGDGSESRQRPLQSRDANDEDVVRPRPPVDGIDDARHRREGKGPAETPWCDRCIGLTVFTKEMKDRGMPPACGGLKTRFPYDRARELTAEEAETSGEIEFDCCIGTSYQSVKMRKEGVAPICTTGVHVARYRWAQKESAVVTNPDGAAVNKPVRNPPPLSQDVKPKSDRAFAGDGTRFPRSTWSESLKSAWNQSLVIVKKTGEKVVDLDYSRRYLENMKNANHRLVEQAGKQVARVQKFLEQVQEKRK
mmetsp:Transcript_13850/g.32883  ORF Transcript_13850/g.32883 Transcript_13850/m.32883 type:complete len:255 (+) Transcript_13850:126-890(+)|eukprot:CAMPEP_0177690606 /NCGR_PEP_ID=MMETSP0484_2-20121128/858_1 /TAXON_ID=354590 /ORGANISM="Rhodomonas lens, Strain RHODO" /LENGTH=254 /DNA_ID=CAMNT_0019201165 /DNA_START=52 /DNA_END=816 /DNA_ORIENTATION=-